MRASLWVGGLIAAAATAVSILGMTGVLPPQATWVGLVVAVPLALVVTTVGAAGGAAAAEQTRIRRAARAALAKEPGQSEALATLLRVAGPGGLDGRPELAGLLALPGPHRELCLREIATTPYAEELDAVLTRDLATWTEPGEQRRVMEWFLQRPERARAVGEALLPIADSGTRQEIFELLLRAAPDDPDPAWSELFRPHLKELEAVVEGSNLGPKYERYALELEGG